MKKILFVVLALAFVVSVSSAQHVGEQLFKLGTNKDASGSTWAASATHYTEPFSMIDYDSAQVVFDFPDSVDVDIYVEQFAFTGGVALTSSRIDSLRYVTDGTGVSKAFALSGVAKQGFPIWRLKLMFQTGSDTQGTEKYRMFLKRYRSGRLAK